MNNNNLRRRVMTRVYFEYIKDVVIRHPDYFMFVVFMITSFALVSTGSVINNILKTEPASVFNFFLFSLRDTSLILQILIVGFIVRTVISGLKLINKNLSSKLTLVKLKY